MAVEKNYNEKTYDVLFLIFLFISIFLALSIYSYSPDDPSFSNIVFTDYKSEVHNYFGKLGAYSADFFGTIFGWSSLFLPLMFLFLTLNIYFVKKGKYSKGIVYVNALLFFLILAGMSLFTGFTGVDDFYFHLKYGGGVIGLVSRDFLASLIGDIGGIILSLFVVLSSVFLFIRINFTNFSFKQMKPNIKFNLKKSNSRKTTKERSPKKPPKKNGKKGDKSQKTSAGDTESEDEDVKVSDTFEPENVKKARYSIPLNLLEESEKISFAESEAELRQKGKILEEKLHDFGVNGHIREIKPGPVVTLYEFEPAPGVKVNKISNLENDLALAMSAVSVRIIAPIPGKSVVGIELPNKRRAAVSLRELINTKDFAKPESQLTIILGKDIAGKPYITDLTKMPHLLIAGTTGSGKSVSVNTIICSIIYKSSPENVKFVMVDPKMVELSVYEDIPHLAAPVVTDPRKAANVLKNVVEEMENRYTLLADNRVRNIDSYNEKASKSSEMEKMPYLVVVVDEFADLMIVAGKEVEQSIMRIAQMARAVGIHLILATQRPSVNVITGIIKANMPARLSFRVSSKTDSRTILDQNGAETLLGKGDSLFIPPGHSDPVRIHGCFVSEWEVNNIVTYLKKLGTPEYNMDLVKEDDPDAGDVDETEKDEKYYEALDLVQKKGTASISMVQRYLRIGYNRAARIIEIMEKEGVITPSDGTSKPREVIIKD
ncbi:cell division protein FtsK/SpoIIIE [Flexistipes sinusarabici DSM 4947]|uniref:Cell division protein FtsK/SpoIIIE n=2 Tax=Flexistipes sinusarabici TaxID=2352 RepID=F8E6M6_FLESM|nr:DNA translocase FtsK [Flexistipes sinusarabici]AEI15916.1 cell division protein FtsK/SpoIIIE [Flexistipes sinusarabici DSM 4947]